mgnify:CR=1 FL=1
MEDVIFDKLQQMSSGEQTKISKRLTHKIGTIGSCRREYHGTYIIC